jgi:glycosyltransferase involved in cell wall biosynthesis
MNNGKGRNIAYIVSMPNGMDAWSFREIEALAEDGINIAIFPLRYAPGPYMPKQNWDCYLFNKWLVIPRQLLWLIRYPITYVRLLLEAIRTRSLIDFLLGFDFAQQMAKRKIEMIHSVFGGHQLLIGYYCKKILKTPLSVALYGYDLRDNPNWSMFRRAVESCDNIIVNCDFHKQLLGEIVGNELGQKAKVIRHYAQVPVNGHFDKVKILIVGRFMERKGHDLLFQAVRGLGAEADNIEVWVAGLPGTVDVQQLAHDLGVEDKVRIFGSVTDQALDVLYQQCDIFCLPSRTDSQGVSEGLPVSLIEAMSHGKPVIATRLAGIPELVEEVLVDEGDVQGLAKALKRFIDDPELRRSSGARNQEIVKDRYSKQNVYVTRDLWLGILDGGVRV